MHIDEINVVVWNTQIKAVKSKFDIDRWRKVKRVIYHLILTGVDLIGLIEVDGKCVDYFKKIFKRCGINFDVADGTCEIFNTRFDTCIIYNTNKLTLIPTKDDHDCSFNQSFIGDKTFKAGQKFLFFDNYRNQIFTIVMVHWASKLTPEYEQVRDYLAINLRLQLDEWLKENDNIIITGDFNTEPYCTSLTHHVCSLREIEAMSRKKAAKYFYNPSWSLLTNPPLAFNPNNLKILGTYFYNGKSKQHWYVLDQVMFSKSFIDGSNSWKFLDDSLKILGYFDVTKKKDRISDHLPIHFKMVWRK